MLEYSVQPCYKLEMKSLYITNITKYLFVFYEDCFLFENQQLSDTFVYQTDLFLKHWNAAVYITPQ